MGLHVEVFCGAHRLAGEGAAVELTNRWLKHLQVRNFSLKTVRAYAFDALNFSRFLEERCVELTDVGPMDVFDWLAWQRQPVSGAGRCVVRLAGRRGAAPATMNRRVAAVRSLFEFAVMSGVVDQNPVPSVRRGVGWRQPPRGLLGHVAGRRTRSDGRLVRQPQRLPESLPDEQVAVFLALLTYLWVV